MNTYKIIRTDMEEFPYNVKILTQLSDGRWWYCGNGKFCRNMEEVKATIKKYHAVKI